MTNFRVPMFDPRSDGKTIHLTRYSSK